MVTYQKPVAIPYDLTVQTAGLVLTAHCPLDAPSAKPAPPNGAILVCDGNGFMVATANALNGAATPVGTNAVDARVLSFEVELRRPSAAKVQRTAKVVLTHIERPNGTDCPSVCYGRQGTLDLEP